MTVVYLASAIDQAGDTDEEYEHRVNVRDLGNKISGWGFPVYTPALAWKTPPGLYGDSLAIDSVNRTALARADVLVAYLPGGVASVGVPTEIEAHTTAGKIAIVIGEFNSVVLDANPRVRRMRQVADWNVTLKALRLLLEEASLEAIDGDPDMNYALRAFVKQTSTRQPLAYRVTDADHPQPGLTRTYSGDAGLDLTTTYDSFIREGAVLDIPCGVAVQIPEGTFGWVVARSSTFKNWGVLVTPGIIDAGYQGELKVCAFRPTRYTGPDTLGDTGTLRIPAGTRLAQLVLLPNLTAGYEPAEVVEFTEVTARGTNGWGSSGK